ncbi:MAG: hypothetical protein GY803_09565 [Chloroflexi bacterium]|nr:hypothetical protein [Chloroflexota bacterium]
MKTEKEIIRELIQLQLDGKAMARAASGDKRTSLQNAINWLNEADRNITISENQKG